MNEVIVYTTEDGQSRFKLLKIAGQVWLSELETADLYQITKQNHSLHI